MTLRRALGLLATVAVVALAVVLFRAGAASFAPAAAVSPAPRPTDSTWPSFASASAAPDASPAASQPPVVTAPSAGPAPFIQTFAAQPGVRPQPALPSPTSTRSVPVNIDGCDHGYGTRTQCIPWTFPDGATDKCAWLTSHGYRDVKVAGTDRHRLDPDGNGIACDT